MSADLGTHHATRMRHIVICGLPSCKYFSTISHKRHDFRKRLLNTKCVFWFSLQLLSETFPILRTERGMIKNVYRSSCTVPVILVKILWNLNFLDRFSTNTRISNFTKLLPVAAQLFHADGQTDRDDDAESHFTQFYESAYNVSRVSPWPMGGRTEAIPNTDARRQISGNK